MILVFTFPVGDWQFWVVSVMALAAVAYLCRGFLPSRKRRRREKRVTLTIDRKRADS